MELLCDGVGDVRHVAAGGRDAVLVVEKEWLSMGMESLGWELYKVGATSLMLINRLCLISTLNVGWFLNFVLGVCWLQRYLVVVESSASIFLMKTDGLPCSVVSYYARLAIFSFLLDGSCFALVKALESTIRSWFRARIACQPRVVDAAANCACCLDVFAQLG